jgi:nucleoside-diphosphate-sugar epimerase
MNILITGGTGLIGGAVINRLIDDYPSWGLVAALRKKNGAQHLYNRVKVVEIGGLSPTLDWSATLTNVNVVIHCAGLAHVPYTSDMNHVCVFRSVNVDSTLCLATQAANSGVKRFIFISSVKVNGESTLPNLPFTELDTPLPSDNYGQSKMEAEILLQKLSDKTGMEIVIIRPPLVYGPGVKANFSALIKLIGSGWPLPLGSINNNRSFIGIDNLVDFIVTCISHPNAANNVFLVSDGYDLSTTELTLKIAQIMGVRARLIPIPNRVLRVFGKIIGRKTEALKICNNLQVSIAKANLVLGWSPVLSVEHGLKKIFAQDPKDNCVTK